jgi:hypothetical protein
MGIGCAPVESMKTASAVEKKNNKKLAKEEQFLKDMTRQLNTVKQKSNIVVGANVISAGRRRWCEA